MASHLPKRVVDLLETTPACEFATVSSSGLPIDTPMLVFPNVDFTTFDVCTGLAYPAKAERARKNPKVGLLFEGGEHDPVVSVAGSAAVRDADLQSNAERYLAEVGFARIRGIPWQIARNSVWYWTRILVSITPVRISWWDSWEDMDGPPQCWEGPTGTIYPASDPPPPGAVSPSPMWPQQPWREMAQDALGKNRPGHLTLCDDNGYPLPIRARKIELIEDGFRLDIPPGAPWPLAGRATLSFLGEETFAGEASADSGRALLRVERALPLNAMVTQRQSSWEPSDDILKTLTARLEHELARRSQPIPNMPEHLPEMTAGAKKRHARLEARIAAKTAR